MFVVTVSASHPCTCGNTGFSLALGEISFVVIGGFLLGVVWDSVSDGIMAFRCERVCSDNWGVAGEGLGVSI
jgi:hypothetical protein